MVGPLLQAVSDWSAVALVPTRVTHVRRWAAGGLVLIGDAVHATTPSLAQGANAAIVDAVGLADAVASWQQAGERSGPDAYLTRFVMTRRRKSARQYWLGRTMVYSSQHTSRLAQAAKLVVLRALASNPLSHRLVIETLTGVRS